MLNVAKRILEEEAKNGYDITSWRGNSYTGSRTKHASWGIRHDTVICTLSSYCAQENWKRIADFSTNCSRLDIAQDFLFEKQEPVFFDELFEHLMSVKTTTGRKPTISRAQNSRGSNTIYIGERTSDAYCRIYDKGVESKLYDEGIYIRFEIELRRKNSKGILTNLSNRNDPYSAIATIISNRAKSLRLHWPLDSLPSIEVARVDSISDDEKRLRYLSTTIKPIIDKLTLSGRADEALAILFGNAEDLLSLNHRNKSLLNEEL
ncbi:MAG: replication initiation factor domain-containing protein [Exiguobacterium sp.]